MKMHEHEACKSKNIMGLVQSNPTSTHDFNIVKHSKYTSKMHESLLKCKCDAHVM